MMKRINLILIFLIIGLAKSGKISYDGYTLYGVTPTNDTVLDSLRHFEKTEGIDFWRHPRAVGNPVHVCVSPLKRTAFKSFLEKNNINVTIIQTNIRLAMDNEKRAKYVRGQISSMVTQSIYPYDDILMWMEDIASDNFLTATRVTAGKTSNGRLIHGLKIAYGGGGKNVIFVEAGIHPREFITITAAIYLISDLLYSSDNIVMDISTKYDWHIFPVVNPDGYIHAFEKDRLYKTNRPDAEGDVVHGVDLDTNWIIDHSAWENLNFTEPETTGLANYLKGIRSHLGVYISLHAYAQAIMLPRGSTKYELKLANKIVQSLKGKFKNEYKFGSFSDMKYPPNGTSVDWVKSELKTPLVFHYDMPDASNFGYLLPPEQKQRACQELLHFLIVLVTQSEELGILRSGGLCSSWPDVFAIGSSLIIILLCNLHSP